MAEERKGIFGFGLFPEGPLLRRRLKSKDGDTVTDKDPLEEVEINLKNYLSSLERAVEKSECSLCRELLLKIKMLPLNEQERVIPELRQFLTLAESAESQETVVESLKGMPSLRKVMGDG